jgi:hypothetical protein
MRGRLGRLATLGHGARTETSQRAQTIVHDNSASGCDIEGKGRWNPHQMMTPRHQIVGQYAALRTKHIGGTQWVGEVREILGLIQDFDPDQAASLGQVQLVEAAPMVDGQMSRGFRRIGSKFKRSIVGTKSEHKICPKSMRRAQQIAEIDGLGNAFHADREIAAGSREQGFHTFYLPQAWRAKKARMGNASAVVRVTANLV